MVSTCFVLSHGGRTHGPPVFLPLPTFRSRRDASVDWWSTPRGGTVRDVFAHAALRVEARGSLVNQLAWSGIHMLVKGTTS